MKWRTIALVLVVLNVGLLALVAYMGSAFKQPSPAASTARERVVTNTVRQIAVRKVNATNILAALANRLNWASIESTNYLTYMENLRAIGCPEETIRDIILTDIAKAYARRRAEIRAQGGGYRFWQTSETGEIGDTSDPQLLAQLAALDREQSALVRELLGVDYHAEMARYTGDEDYEQRVYGFLPEEKRAQLLGVQSKYDELERQIYERTRGFLLDEDQEALRRLRKQRETELAQILTPEELEECQLRGSPTANNLRAQLHGFNPSEEEFRRIFRLQKAFDDQYGTAFDLTDPNQAEVQAAAQEQAQQALDSELRKILGNERFAQYQRAQDSDYRMLLQFGERFQTPPELADRVYNIKLDAETQKLRLESDPNLAPEQRAQALADIARATENEVARAMGGQNSQLWLAYQKIGNQWIQNLGQTDFVVQNEMPAEQEPPPQPRLFPFFPQYPPLPVAPQ